MLRVLIIVVACVAILTAIYVGLTAVARARRARELAGEHAAGKGSSLTREDYVARGLAEYDRSTPRGMLAAILAAPLAVLLLLIFLAGG